MKINEEFSPSAIAALLASSQFSSIGFDPATLDGLAGELAKDGCTAPIPLSVQIDGVDVEMDVRLMLLAGDEGTRIELRGVEPPTPGC